MPATKVFYKNGEYLSSAGFVVPCIVVTGYDAGGLVTTTEGSVVTADLLLLNEGITRLVGVTKGTGNGQFQFGA
jgi:hypothetical protein